MRDIEDVPGLGKTMLARAMAISIGLDFRRIQFTAENREIARRRESVVSASVFRA